MAHGHASERPNRRLKLSSSPKTSSNLFDCLPNDILSLVVEISLGSIQDVRVIGSVSRDFHLAVTSVTRNANAPLWENEFRNIDPVLYQSYVTSKDQRSSWQKRLEKLLQLRTEGLVDVSSHACPLDANKDRSTSQMCDVILHNHPDHGFLVNVGGTRTSVVIYGVRLSPTPGNVSSSVKFVHHFNTPSFAAGAMVPLGPSSDNLLVLHSLDGMPVSAHRDFDEVVSTIKSSGELCRWRFLHYSKANPQSLMTDGLPSECNFSRPSID